MKMSKKNNNIFTDITEFISSLKFATNEERNILIKNKSIEVLVLLKKAAEFSKDKALINNYEEVLNEIIFNLLLNMAYIYPISLKVYYKYRFELMVILEQLDIEYTNIDLIELNE